MAYQVKDKEGNVAKRDDKEIYGQDFLEVVKTVDLKKRTLRIIATDETRDRDGDVIKTKGWSKNPVFLWAHDYRSVPLAAAKRIERKRSPWRVVLTHRFPTKGLNPFADMILNLYHEKVINAGSVGFIPIEWEELKEGDPELEGEEGKGGRYLGKRFIRQEMLEHSGCPVPANPNAIQDMVSTYGKQFNIEDSNVEKVLSDMKTVEDIEGELEEIKKDVEVIEETAPFIQVPETIETLPAIFDDFDEITKEEKPYPNEHACRLQDPSKFDRFARKNCAQKHDDKCIDVIYGITDNKTSIQALRYPKKNWKASEARKHCKGRDGSFEAAAESTFEENFLKSIEGAVYFDEETGFFKRCVDGYWIRDFEDDAFTGLVNFFEKMVKEYFAEKSLKEEVNELREKFYILLKIGAVLSRKNKSRLEIAMNNVKEVLSDAGAFDENAESDSAEQARQKELELKGKGSNVFDAILENEESREKEVKGEPERIEITVSAINPKTKNLIDGLKKIKV
jgi:hypothetical protein